MLRTILYSAGLLSVIALVLTARVVPDTIDNRVPASGDETLLLFLQNNDEHFRNTTLPELEKWTKAEGIHLRVLDAAEGVPAGITATPAIVFANERGRAIYASRYTEWNTIRNFVRTNRLRARAEVPFCTEQTLQWATGRGRVNAPIKLTDLQGELPANWSATAFHTAAVKAIGEGMTAFVVTENACLARTDRAFYCDVHPYRSAAGELFLSLEVYSMFNCIRPVFTTADLPLQGDFAEAEQLFRQAGERFETIIKTTLADSEEGDRWTALPLATPTIAWTDLGLAAPIVANTTAVTDLNMELAPAWSRPTAVLAGVPTLFFNFLPPLDRYAGEVPDFDGDLRLHDNGSLASGTFVAQLKTMTMGMKELDDKVKKKYIFTKRFPEASFAFEIPDAGPALRAGVVNRVPIAGVFTFMKKEIPLTVQAEITPQLDEQQHSQLYVHVDFELNVTDDFGVQGPDGPERASKHMAFDLNFFLSPEKNN
ncbi:MAG: YceI family protein [Bacteroidota bacterium]